MALRKRLVDNEPSWLFDCHRMSTLKQRLRLQIDWRRKKGALFSLIYFFGSFCIYYMPQDYVIPQAMPHAIPQTHSVFYPHRVKFCLFACSFLLIVLQGVLGAKRDTSEILQKSERSVSSYQVCNYRTSKTRD